MGLGTDLFAIGANIVGDILNYDAQMRNLSYQKYNDQRNYNMQVDQYNYQKYLNRNQTQIQSADAQKAGINPLAMSGGSLSSGSYSNVNSSATAPQFDMSGLMSILNTKMNIEAQKSLAEDSADLQRDLKQKEIDYQTERDRLDREHDTTVQNAKNQTQLDVAEANNTSAETISANELDFRRDQEKVAVDRVNAQLKEEGKRFDYQVSQDYAKYVADTAIKNQGVLSDAYHDWFVEVFHHEPTIGDDGPKGWLTDLCFVIADISSNVVHWFNHFVARDGGSYSDDLAINFRYWFKKRFGELNIMTIDQFAGQYFHDVSQVSYGDK